MQCGCFNVWVCACAGFVTCGCFGNIYIHILVFTVFVLFRLRVFILICFVCTSVSTTATE